MHSTPHARALAPTRYILAAAAIALLTLITPLAVAGPLENAVDRIENKVDNLRTNLNTVKSNVQNLPGTVQNNLGFSLEGDTKDRILEVVEDARATFEEERTNLEAFGDGSEGTGCFDFKNALRTFTGSIGSITNTIFSLGRPAGTGFSLDVSDQVDLIDAIPCKALLVPSLAFNRTPLSGLTEEFPKISADLETVRFLYDPDEAGATPASAGPMALPGKCDVINNRAIALKAAGRQLAVRALALKAVGAYIDPDELKGGGPIALKVKPGEKIIGIHGYGSLTLAPPKNDKRAAGALKFLGNTLDSISDYVFKQVRHCEVVNGQRTLVTELCAARRFRSDLCKTLTN